MKYVKYLIVVTALLVLMGFFSACGESEDVVNEMPEGLYPMCDKGNLQELWGYVDETGEYVIEPQFLSAGCFVKGIAAVQDLDSELYGYIDEYGKYIIEPQFYTVDGFNSEGIAAVGVPSSDPLYKYGKWGYIDVNGEYIIDPQFRDAGGFSGGYAVVEIANSVIQGAPVYNLIDEEGNRYDCDENDLRGWDFSQGPKRIVDEEDEDLVGYVDENGKWTIKPDKKYKAGDTAWSVYFSGGLRGFEKKEKYDDNVTITLIGFFDEHGKEVIPAEFCEVMYPFYNDVALVASPAKKDGEKAIYGYINKKGKYLMKKEYDFDLDRVRD